MIINFINTGSSYVYNNDILYLDDSMVIDKVMCSSYVCNVTIYKDSEAKIFAGCRFEIKNRCRTSYL